ncbi:carboxy terminal-processing peptidase [Salinisphaera sp. USBA-960]|uniref:carboxy terminal-processing peptidase n=1 Tax=Salinisphaera orenii TaxID=856731 RepID=UPI000DBE28CD|nr:carboxy terminal-processing peptidase [Salifodinibacter halophilus]NNC25424.1 carboxy terminal-processing peptidase [Salifodinibacter halophilus]
MPSKFFYLVVIASVAAQTGCAAGVNSESNSEQSSAPKKVDQISFQPLKPTGDQSAVAKQVATKLQGNHYDKKKLDDDFSRELFKAYIDDLDPSHDILCQSDVTELRQQYGDALDNQLKKGETGALYAIFNRYQKRRMQMERFALNVVESDFDSLDLESDRALRTDRSKAPRPVDETAQRDLWRKKLVNQVIREHLHGTESEKVQHRLKQRYRQNIRRLAQIKSRDAFSAFMHAVTHSYDPHTDYFSPERSKNFSIDMNLKLQGIGAQLRTKNGYAELVRLIPGGPAAKNGQLKPADRILAVGQGKDGEFTNVVGMRLDHTVQMIRGKADTVVRLRVSSGEASQTRVVTLTRAKIKLKDQAAQHQVMSLDFRGQTQKVGLVTLPSFYNGTAADVKEALTKLKKADVQGVVLDLRNDGGGALGEAMKLIGLFMPPAPGVQIQDAGGDVQVLGDRSPNAFYSGPLVVLVNRLSASASEITAAALQDYGRAIVVGSQTFGKGTVQTILPLKSGELKLTEAKFYRVTGDSTQVRGVTPGIKFPSAVDPEKIGESALQNALPWDRIPPTRYPHSDSVNSKLKTLRTNHKQRAKDQPDFHYLAERIRMARKQGGRSKVSLNIDKRRKHRNKMRATQLQLANEHRKATDKDPFKNYEQLKAHDDAEGDIENVNTRRAQDKTNAFETEAGRIVLDLRRLLKKQSDQQTAA